MLRLRAGLKVTEIHDIDTIDQKTLRTSAKLVIIRMNYLLS